MERLLVKARSKCAFWESCTDKAEKLAPTQYCVLPRTQSPERLRAFLNELAEKGKIEIIPRDEIRAGLKTYIITQSGKDTVNRYVNASTVYNFKIN